MALVASLVLASGWLLAALPQNSTAPKAPQQPAGQQSAPKTATRPVPAHGPRKAFRT